MKPKSLLLLLPPPLPPCSRKKNSDQSSEAAVQITEPEFPQIVPFGTGIETGREILLSEIAGSIRYTPLETNNECPIRELKGTNIIQTKEYFFLPRLDKLFQYTEDGKFMRTLGCKGGGPGEFNWIMQVDVDEEKGLVHILTTIGKINIYPMEIGKSIRAMKVPNIEVSELVMLRVQDTIAATFMRNNNGRRKERTYLPNLKGNTLQIFNRWDLFELNSQYRWVISSDIDRYTSHYENHTCYKEHYNDILFTVTLEALEPRYIFQMGRYSLSMEYRFEYLDGNGKRFQETVASYIQYSAIETDSYIFISYSNWAEEKARERQMAIHDKKAKNCFKVATGHIKNDLIPGLPLRPVMVLDSHTLLYVWEVPEFLEKAEETPSILQIEQLKDLREEDNLVMMLVYLKQP